MYCRRAYEKLIVNEKWRKTSYYFPQHFDLSSYDEQYLSIINGHKRVSKYKRYVRKQSSELTTPFRGKNHYHPWWYKPHPTIRHKIINFFLLSSAFHCESFLHFHWNFMKLKGWKQNYKDFWIIYLCILKLYPIVA